MISNPRFYKFVKHRCMILLIIMISYFCLEPFLFSFFTIDACAMMLFYLFVIYSPVIITLSKKYFYLITVLVVLGVCSYQLYSYTDAKTFFYLNYVFTSLADLSAILVIVFYVLSKDIKSKEDIFASIIVFLLIGGTFGDIYYSMEQINPGSLYFTYVKSGLLHLPVDNMKEMVIGYRDFLYFSFSTITTLGYGDIVPHSDTAKRLSSIEASIGVLYTAIFIGRIVGAGLSNKLAIQREKDNQNNDKK